MLRSTISIGLVLGMLACDFAAWSTFRVAPTPVAPGDTAVPQRSRAAADVVAAVERVTQQFGLIPIEGVPQDGCPRRWYNGGITVCLKPLTDGGMEVRVAEVNGWKRQGLLVRQVMSDTLARYGGTLTAQTPR